MTDKISSEDFIKAFGGDVNEPKAWVVFGTRLGYVVSRKKMTRTEAMILETDSSIRFDYSKELGFWYAEHFISSVAWDPEWTEKEAQRYCDKENEKLRKNIKSST